MIILGVFKLSSQFQLSLELKKINITNIPKCFFLKNCHIKQITKDKFYTDKNKKICEHCVNN